MVWSTLLKRAGHREQQICSGLTATRPARKGQVATPQLGLNLAKPRGGVKRKGYNRKMTAEGSAP